MFLGSPIIMEDPKKVNDLLASPTLLIKLFCVGFASNNYIIT